MNKAITKRTLPLSRAFTIFTLGGVAYYFIEILYRGYSHWSMAVCGGICLWGICFINEKARPFHCIWRALICTAFITAVEFSVGCIVNLWLGWDVWSYKGLPFNFMGQISLLFSCYWFLLSFGVCLIISFLKYKAKKKELSKTTP